MADLRVAIMQPYLFPYIGYFQLISAVDRFVLYDDVQWIKGGWINRNRIQIRGEPHYITVPISSDGHRKPIHQRQLAASYPLAVSKILAQLEDAYRRAPYYQNVRDLVSDCLNTEGRNVCELVIRSMKSICSFLDIQTPLIRSTSLPPISGCGVHRVVEVVRHLSGLTYINAIGGRELYAHEDFQRAGLRLQFLLTGDVQYPQLMGRFIPSLSIIDVLMFNSPQETRELLGKFELVQ
ncbi:MAG: WbqC family protein [Planctomycetota bacterium]